MADNTTDKNPSSGASKILAEAMRRVARGESDPKARQILMDRADESEKAAKGNS